MRIRRFLHLVLLLGACGLVWKVWLTWSHARPPLVTNGSSSLVTPLPTVSQARPATGKKLSRLITAKNLFAPERQPPKEQAPKQEEQAPVPPPEHLKLVGVFATDGRREALFTDASQGGKVVRVLAGGTLESYQVTRLTHAEAVLTLGQGGEEVSLRIGVQKSAEAAKAPRIIPARSTPQTQAEPTEEGQAQGESPEGQPDEPPDADAARTLVLGAGAGAPQPAAKKAPSAAKDEQDDPASIRQNIRQLQRRLREVRRQRAREVREARRAEERDS